MGSTRRLAAGTAGLVAVVAIAVAPSLAADPSPRPDPPGRERSKADKGPETPVTVSGTIRATTDENGRTEYAVTSGGTTFELDAGPPWWFGRAHPLAGLVGTSVAITGTTRGNGELDVETIDGRALREPGRPPWAGGPKVVGERHPGFKPWKADLWADGQPGRGKDGPPGQLKPKPSEAPGS